MTMNQATSNLHSAPLSWNSQPIQDLSAFIETLLNEMGYELAAIEVVNHREKILRLFIDKTDGVTIDDCVKVTHALDQPLEASTQIMDLFKGPYDLEVSSPGIDRLLQREKDFIRFAGSIGRVQTFRALTGDETGASEYSLKNPKQKNFYGMIRGFESESQSILFGVSPEDGTRKIKHETLIRIPLELVAKAHLEPTLDLPEESKKDKKKNGVKKP